MKKIKSLFKSLSIFLLVLSLVFSASINIFAHSMDKSEIDRANEAINTVNNEQRNDINVEDNVGKILDKYTGYTDNFAEKINSQDVTIMADIVGAMLSRYNMATEDEQRKFNEYIEKTLKILKNERNSGFINDIERQYNILSNKKKYVNPDISLYTFEEYPELFENIPKEDLDGIDETYKFFINVGNILDKYSDNKENYREKVFSAYSKDALDVITRALDIFEIVSEEERYELNYYISGVLSTLKHDYPYRFSPELEERYKALKQKERSRQDKVLPYASEDEKYLVFDVGRASWYAHQYHERYNTVDYPDLSGMGGDCTNFVSQILKHGGYSPDKPYHTPDKNWYIKRKNYKYNKPQNSKELNESWLLADPSPWISAK